MSKYGHLIYTKTYEADLTAFIEHDISKHAQRLYLLYSLNYNTYSQQTSPLSDQEAADLLNIHRTTILRARAELEEAGLIMPTNRTSKNTNQFHLPHRARIDDIAGQKKKDNEQKAKEKAFARKRAEMENVLNRRLTQPEILNLKRKMGLA